MTNATSTCPEDLREQMINHIRTAGHLPSERIEQAFRAVPRHRFVPDASVEEAYANKAITIKPGKDRPASCISVPTVVAMMLGQLDPRPGEHVLEIGAEPDTTPPSSPNSSDRPAASPPSTSTPTSPTTPAALWPTPATTGCG
ncbi:Protein-L-isoaspartate(D-aspartate) O-methyltransferase (PCMT) [Actinoalloteichus cyanogriseus DSM 43889]|uniref:Protein-L-isoaspartate O-methyltransferase n=1 Tax=Actinoalloteichus caeruleus DSM 43889 TaxID=1120930 RepID=A0ABT1JEV2_ACTCY|nr:Protein-L-isoaspartate(D-aspartate) O-methyltransferase (PCMT) [Actinoalloteichus caeruleus DSM 43889]